MKLELGMFDMKNH